MKELNLVTADKLQQDWQLLVQALNEIDQHARTKRNPQQGQ